MGKTRRQFSPLRAVFGLADPDSSHTWSSGTSDKHQITFLRPVATSGIVEKILLVLLIVCFLMIATLLLQ